MLIALIKVRTVNLTEISCSFPSPVLQDSRYTRVKRFFREFKIDFSSVAVWVVHCFSLSGQSLHLSIDRTNWRWGKKDINILMLSIVYKGIAIPLLWTLLAKRGNSDTQERIELIQRYIIQFGKSMIAGLLADRERGQY